MMHVIVTTTVRVSATVMDKNSSNGGCSDVATFVEVLGAYGVTSQYR